MAEVLRGLVSPLALCLCAVPRGRGVGVPLLVTGVPAPPVFVLPERFGGRRDVHVGVEGGGDGVQLDGLIDGLVLLLGTQAGRQMATGRWLQADGYRQRATGRWLQADGYRQRATGRWLQAEGYRQIATAVCVT